MPLPEIGFKPAFGGGACKAVGVFFHAAPLQRVLPAHNVEGGSLGAIVRSYKSAVTRQLGLAGGVWQRNYYEHIIRDERDHRKIHDYIVSNPVNWETDEENK